jgi:hypothetical protein
MIPSCILFKVFVVFQVSRVFQSLLWKLLQRLRRRKTLWRIQKRLFFQLLSFQSMVGLMGDQEEPVGVKPVLPWHQLLRRPTT